MAEKQGRLGPISTIDAVAVGASLVWLALMIWALLSLGVDRSQSAATGPLTLALTIVAVFLPIALIWIAASATRTAQTVREESARLQAAIDSMRSAYVSVQSRTAAAVREDVEARIGQVARAQATMGVEIASLVARQSDATVLTPSERPPAPDRQPILALEPEDAVEPQPLPAEDFSRALNFPENERDQDGFRVLRAALDHPPTAELVRAAQDVLTLLSQDGIYMDDLPPRHAPPAVWRAFAQGQRGDAVGALAGIQDRSSVALTHSRMKEDPVFRDAIHQFLRLFDKALTKFAETASDAEIVRFADTRSARAFMLAGKVTGSFG